MCFRQETNGMKDFDALFFDLDGTLLDTGSGIMRCAAYALEKAGISVKEPDSLRAFVGPPLSVTFPQFGIPDGSTDEAIRNFRELYHTEGKYECEPYAGIETALDQLGNAGFRLFVATSKPEALANELLERFGLSRCFEIIAGATLDRSREKKADVLRYLMAQTDCRKPLMIGDTVFDVTGAAEAGLPCLVAGWGYGSAEEMKKAGALDAADDPAGMCAWLLNETEKER